MIHATADHTAGLNRVILDCVADGVFTVDREFRITSFNRAAERITGVPRDEAVGALCSEVFRTELCDGKCALRETIRTGKPAVSRAVHMIRPDGTRLPISVSTAVLFDDDGIRIGGVETFRDLSLVTELKRELLKRDTFNDIVSRNPAMHELFRILPEVSRSESTVLIEGPSGSGKELFARAIHDLSGRRDGPFVAVNCGAIPEALLESEIFGYVRGAFTGANQDRAGRLAAAAGGTLFLDEIGELSPMLQVRLLRVLEERTYQPLGTNRTLTADVRIVSATNRELSSMLEAGEFREDLYYRLNVIRLALPPLADRREDIPLLVEHLIGRLSRVMGKDVSGVTDGALSLLMGFDWPGNVRELRNALEYAFVLCPGGLIDVSHLPASLAGLHDAEPAPRTLEESEARFLREVLAKHGGCRAAAARQLGIHKTTLWRKMKRHGIT
jgi:PAS domain S-box-containing protein